MKFVHMASIFFLLLASPAFGQTHGEHGDHQMMDASSGHNSMQMMNSQSIMLGEKTVDGISGMAHLNDIGKMMSSMGRKENFHFMMMLADAKSHAGIDQATIAVKITEVKTGTTTEAIPLVGMGGHFGADIVLAGAGEYRFVVGTKLQDGSKRQFEFSYTVK